MEGENGLRELYDIIAGPAFVVATREADFDSLTPAQALHYKKLFYRPEVFLRTGKEIIAIPYDSE